MTRADPRSAVAAVITARLSYAILAARPPGGSRTWTRTNHRGEPITLLEGPAVVLGGLAGAALGRAGSQRERAAMTVAGLGAAVFGGYDDLAGNAASKGFRGHLSALRRGELTSGAVKIVGIGATGLTAAMIAAKPGGRRSGPLAPADVVINAGLVAGLANLLNLFDLRPGRAIKVAVGTGGLLAALPGQCGQASVAPLAAAVALLPEDLAEHSMLGDAGANGIGAMLGVAATRLPRSARVTVFAAVAGLTAASEVVSFTRVIERTGPLRWLDMLGRRPAAAGPGQHNDPPATSPRPAPPASTVGDAGTAAPHSATEPGTRRAAGHR